jgi:hypothetical protein
MRSSKEIVKDEGWGLPGEIDRSDDFGGRAGWCGLVERSRVKFVLEEPAPSGECGDSSKSFNNARRAPYS